MKKLVHLSLFISFILVMFTSCKEHEEQWQEPSKESPTVLASYYIDTFCSNTSSDGTIVFSWKYVSEEFDYLNIVVNATDGSFSDEKTITDKNVTEYKITGVAGKIYSYSFTPYSSSGNIGKAFTGTRYVSAGEIEKALPTLVVTTKDYEWPDCDYVTHPEGSCGEGLTNNDYVMMNVVLYDADGTELYRTDDDYKSKIKIRGNTSAYGDKKPYKIKLDKKADLLAPITGRTGKQYKDKEWLLMTNGTTLNNVIGFATNEYLGIEYTPEYAYVELIVNGDYRGIYMIVESVKQGNVDGENQSRCQVEDDGYVFENDPYWWNEDVFFRTDRYHFQYTFKYPDTDDITQSQIDYLKQYMDNFETALAKNDNSYLDYIDVDSFVSWVLVHEYLGANDGAGSNQYLMLRNSKPSTKVEMTTTWDFDGIMNSKDDNKHANINRCGFFFSNKLLEKRSFHDLCSEKYEATKDGILDAINAKIDALNSVAIDVARQNDAIRWRNSATIVASQKVAINTWINNRLAFLEREY